MSVRQSRAIAGAFALFAFAAVVLEIALVRMYSALLGQHFGVAWTMVLPLGVALGALVTVFASRRYPSAFRAATLAHVASFASPAAALSVIVGVRARGVDNFDADALQQLALFFGTSLLPFVFVGALLSKTLGASQRHAPTLLKVAFAAAACGLVAAAFVMRFGPARIGERRRRREFGGGPFCACITLRRGRIGRQLAARRDVCLGHLRRARG
ncbi:MAG: hypothetical protein IPM54_02885 [Polyangiaceae bacterium]|nr:hypothetical protein [Polyangiaceae bacterium]